MASHSANAPSSPVRESRLASVAALERPRSMTHIRPKQPFARNSQNGRLSNQDEVVENESSQATIESATRVPTFAHTGSADVFSPFSRLREDKLAIGTTINGIPLGRHPWRSDALLGLACPIMLKRLLDIGFSTNSWSLRRTAGIVEN